MKAQWVIVLVLLLSAATASATGLQLISRPADAAPPKRGGNGNSGAIVMSPDGRYILFASTANNLTGTNNFNLAPPYWFNVYLRDTFQQTTTLVSVNRNGSGGTGDSFPTGISADGRWALFESTADDLVAKDSNKAGDVFIRDVVLHTTQPVDVGTNGALLNPATSASDSVITPNGDYVAFVSRNSLTTNNVYGRDNIYVRNLQTSNTVLASVRIPPVSSYPDAYSRAPELTPDGRYLVFYSTASNLVSGVATVSDIYVRDLVVNTTVLVSTNARALFGWTNVFNFNHSISTDGRFVVFETCSNGAPANVSPGMILRHDLQTGDTEVLTTNALVPLAVNEETHNVAQSPDGRFVAYVTGRPYTNALYLWDAVTGTNTLVSVSLDQATPATGCFDNPQVSDDGRFVVFLSSAPSLVTNALTGEFHLYVRDLHTGVTQLLDTDGSGTGAGVDAAASAALSADGSRSAFASAQLLTDNRHLGRDIFQHLTATGENELISACDPQLSGRTSNGSSFLTPYAVSFDGTVAAFASDADNFIANDTNGYTDVFVRNLITGTNLLVSVNTNGEAGDGTSGEPALSGDGRRIAFTSRADDLVAGDTNQARDVFFRDLNSGTTWLVSSSSNGGASGNGESFAPLLSSDGRLVLFHSTATDLGAGISDATENLFLRDLPTATTYPLTGGGVTADTMTPDGRIVAFIGIAPGDTAARLWVWNSGTHLNIYSNTVVSGGPVALSLDGQKLAYVAGAPASLHTVDLATKVSIIVQSNSIFPSHAQLGFSADGRWLSYAASTNGNSSDSNVHLYDFQTGTNLLVSKNTNGTGAGRSDSPVISADGRYIAYRSDATNLTLFDTNKVPDLFVYDITNQTTWLLSAAAAGGTPAADRSLQPVFTADGQSLFFQSAAPNLSPNDLNRASDIFLLNLALLPIGGTTNLPQNLLLQLLPPDSFNPYPILAWPEAAGIPAGYHFQGQYKDSLNDPYWLDLPGPMVTVGANGFISDTSPPASRRFYRIILIP